MVLPSSGLVIGNLLAENRRSPLGPFEPRPGDPVAVPSEAGTGCEQQSTQGWLDVA